MKIKKFMDATNNITTQTNRVMKISSFMYLLVNIITDLEIKHTILLNKILLESKMIGIDIVDEFISYIVSSIKIVFLL